MVKQTDLKALRIFKTNLASFKVSPHKNPQSRMLNWRLVLPNLHLLRKRIARGKSGGGDAHLQ